MLDANVVHSYCTAFEMHHMAPIRLRNDANLHGCRSQKAHREFVGIGGTNVLKPIPADYHE
jgi:hypothetical protein